MGTTRKYQDKESSLLLAKKESLDIIPKQDAPLSGEDKGLQPGTVTDIHAGSPITTHKRGLLPHHAVWGHTLHVQRTGRVECLEGTEFNVLMKVYSGHPIGGICSGTFCNSLEILSERKRKLGNLLVVVSEGQQQSLLRTWVTGDATLSPVASAACELSLLPVWKENWWPLTRGLNILDSDGWQTLDLEVMLNLDSRTHPTQQMSIQESICYCEHKRLETWDWYLDREFVST